MVCGSFYAATSTARFARLERPAVQYMIRVSELRLLFLAFGDSFFRNSAVKIVFTTFCAALVGESFSNDSAHNGNTRSNKQGSSRCSYSWMRDKYAGNVSTSSTKAPRSEVEVSLLVLTPCPLSSIEVHLIHLFETSSGPLLNTK